MPITPALFHKLRATYVQRTELPFRQTARMHLHLPILPSHARTTWLLATTPPTTRRVIHATAKSSSPRQPSRHAEVVKHKPAHEQTHPPSVLPAGHHISPHAASIVMSSDTPTTFHNDALLQHPASF